jgi:hypothetical protein
MAKQTSIHKTRDIQVGDGQVSEVKKETTVTRETVKKKPKKQRTEVTVEVDRE